MLAPMTFRAIPARCIPRISWVPVLFLLAVAPSLAATPPALVNYQGVLRDGGDKPLSGSYDVLFRFMDGATAGNEIMTDQHATVTANAITVAGGLFNVALGSGTIADGSGPGTYTSLDAVFRDYGSVWLEVTVGAETLSPRTRISSAPYALNATHLNGQPAGNFLDTSTTQQAKNGRLNVFNGNAADYALVGNGYGTGGTGVYGSGTHLGVQGVSGDGGTGGSFSGGSYGVNGYSAVGTGGFFSGGGYALHAQGGSGGYYAAGLFEAQGTSRGIVVMAPDTAAHFETTSSSYAPTADLASGNVGVTGSCPNYTCTGVYGTGDSFGVQGVSSGAVAVGGIGGQFTANGPQGIGVKASGITGGQFSSTATPGLSVKLADSNIGVNASGGNYAGYFQTMTASSTGVYASATQTGVNGVGGAYGGNFQANGSGSIGVYASGVDTGLSATGQTQGGYFANSGVERASLAVGGLGISASGSSAGSYFSDGEPWYSYAYVPYQSYGILAYGQLVGGGFHNFNTGSYAWVGTSAYKIYGNGSVSFVQNHPADPSKVIVYAAPEGDEVAVYTRGSGRLVNGEASVTLGKTFALVTNPDIGLTATVTPRGEPIPISVTDVSPGELSVRGPAGSNADFDYMVWGLRIGFEEQSIVQPKQQESKIPSMGEHEKFFAAEPALRNYTALARFKAVAESLGGNKSLDFTRADKLRAAVGVFEYKDAPSGPAPADVPRRPEGPAGDLVPASPPAVMAPAVPGAVAASSGSPRVGSTIASLPLAQGGLEPSPAPIELPVIEPVEAGDLLALDPVEPGKLRRTSSPNDPNVVGIAAQAATSVDGGLRVALVETNYARIKADALFGAIRAGDLLVSSSTPGHAMVGKTPLAGTVIGKALENLDAGTGLIRVLLGAR